MQRGGIRSLIIDPLQDIHLSLQTEHGDEKVLYGEWRMLTPAGQPDSSVSQMAGHVLHIHKISV